MQKHACMEGISTSDKLLTHVQERIIGYILKIEVPYTQKNMKYRLYMLQRFDRLHHTEGKRCIAVRYILEYIST